MPFLHSNLSVSALRMRGFFRGLNSGFFDSIKAFSHVTASPLELLVFSLELASSVA
jgi:hypothetical protein